MNSTAPVSAPIPVLPVPLLQAEQPASPRRPVVYPGIDRTRLGQLTASYRDLDIEAVALRILAGEPEGFEAQYQLELDHAGLRPAGMIEALEAERAWYALGDSLQALGHPRAALMARLRRVWMRPLGDHGALAFGLFGAPAH